MNADYNDPLGLFGPPLAVARRTPGPVPAALTLPVTIRWALVRDLPAIYAIHRAGTDHPRGADAIRDMFREHNHIGMVAEVGEDVVAYSVHAITRRTISLIDLSVAPAYRRQGIGSRLLQRCIAKLDPIKRKTLNLQVRESSLGAQLWLKANGVQCIGIDPGHYDDGEDAFVFVMRADSDSDDSR